MRFALFALCISFALGCGQKGNLYLRENPPSGMRQQKTDPYKPVPYPSEPADEGEAGKK
jgi:predicted small lipoprotein YifL